MKFFGKACFRLQNVAGGTWNTVRKKEKRVRKVEMQLYYTTFFKKN
jgi:hypothetical protein